MYVAIDFETYLISEKEPFPTPVCLSFYDGEATGLVTGMSEMEVKLYELFSSDKTIIAHSATFECGVIWHHFPSLKTMLINALEEGKIICTKIYEQLLNNTRRHPVNQQSLAALVGEYFAEDITEDKKDPTAWRLRYSELDGVPLADWPEKAKDYAISDSVWAFKIHQMQKREKILDSNPSLEAEVHLNLSGALGIEVDTGRVDKLEEEIYALLENSYERLIEKGLCTRILNSKRPKKNMNAFREYIKQAVNRPLYTPKKVVRTDSEALSIYELETQDEIFTDFMNINLYDKILTGYVVNLKKKLVRSQYSATKTTGRTSSYKSQAYPSVNVQQIPRQVPGVTWDVRNCFVPREGYKFVAIDYAGLELATAAHQLKNLFRRSKMCDVINSGDVPTDMHSKLACQIMSLKEGRLVTYQEFMENKKKEPYCHYRQLSKPINLGFPGGIGYDTMRKLLFKDGIKTQFEVLLEANTREELLPAYYAERAHHPKMRIARLETKKYAIVLDELVELKNTLFRTYPELEQFLTAHHNRFETGEYKNMKNEYGEWEIEPMYRYNIYGHVRDWCTYTAFCNGYLMQTPAAIGAKRAYTKVFKEYAHDHRVNVLAFIHDEILLEVLDIPEKHGIIKNVSRIMIESMQSVLSNVRITVEASEMDHWMKAGGNWEKTYWKNIGDDELYEQ